jgi:hypothetical protein
MRGEEEEEEEEEGGGGKKRREAIAHTLANPNELNFTILRGRSESAAKS